MPTILRNLRIDRVASVDKGAGEGVEIMLMKRNGALPSAVEAYLKREFSDDDRKRLAASGAALPDGSFPIENKSDLHNAMQAIGRAKDAGKTKAHIRSRAKALGLSGELSDTFKRDHYGEAVAALKRGVASLFGADVEKRQAADTMISEFDEYLVDKAAAGHADDAGSTGEQGDDEMSAALKKALGLAESATEDDIVKAIAKKDSDAATAVAAIAKAAKEIALLKMSAKHKDFMDKSDMSGDMKDKFTAMSPDERDAHCDKNPIEKRLPLEVQKALAEGEELKKRLAVLEGDKERSDYAKRAADIGLPESEGETLRKAYRGDAEAVKKIETLMKGLFDQVRTGKVFAEFGKAGGGSVDDAVSQLNHVAELYRKGQIAAGKPCSEAQAFTKVYIDPANAELKKRYDAEVELKKRRAA